MPRWFVLGRHTLGPLPRFPKLEIPVVRRLYVAKSTFVIILVMDSLVAFKDPSVPTKPVDEVRLGRPENQGN